MQHAIVFRVITCTSLTVLTRNKVTAQLQVVSSGQKVFSSLGVPLVILVLTTFHEELHCDIKEGCCLCCLNGIEAPRCTCDDAISIFPRGHRVQ